MPSAAPSPNASPVYLCCSTWDTLQHPLLLVLEDQVQESLAPADHCKPRTPHPKGDVLSHGSPCTCRPALSSPVQKAVSPTDSFLDLIHSSLLPRSYSVLSTERALHDRKAQGKHVQGALEAYLHFFSFKFESVLICGTEGKSIYFFSLKATTQNNEYRHCSSTARPETGRSLPSWRG